MTDTIMELRAEIERLNDIIKTGKLCDPRHCTFGNENEIERLRAVLKPFAQAHRDLEAQSEPMPAYHSVRTGDLYDACRALDPKP